MKTIHILITSLGLLFVISGTNAQDIHYSQFNASPLLTNPAKTGSFYRNFRLIANYRNQWRAIDIPYQTFDLMFDMPAEFMGRDMGIGGIVLRDNSSQNFLTTNQVMASIAITQNIGNHQLTIGAQPGVVFKNFSANAVTFGSQFDPSSNNFDPNLPNNETGLNDNASYFDLNMGIQWRTKIKRLFPTAGFSVFHLNRPTVSFINADDYEPIPLRFNLHGNVLIPMNKYIDLNPTFIYSHAGTAKELVAGADAGFNLRENDILPVDLLGFSYFRTNLIENFDAIIIGGGARYLNLTFTMNYDINISALRKASNFRGAFEFAVIYLFDWQSQEETIEPCFII